MTAEAASPKKSALTWLFAIFLPVVGEIATLIMLFSTKTGSLGLGPEPILWMHNLGMVCISIGSNLWLGDGPCSVHSHGFLQTFVTQQIQLV